VFYKQLPMRKEDSSTIEDTSDSQHGSFVLTYYNVFNTEQCDGLEVPTIEAADRREVETDATCEAIVRNWVGRPAIRTEIKTESRAYYRPGTDSVHLPARFRFVDTAHYYSTLFQELVHSTGHPSRLNRDFGKRFGHELYSKEELTAETGAAFLCAIAEIATNRSERNTHSYIQHWIGALRHDNRLMIQAAAAAQRAVDLITDQNIPEKEEEKPG
jgi:antirestriction protein ArdC